MIPVAKETRGPGAPARFERVGLHLDLRIQVMPMRALRRLAARLAELRMNTLMVEWEGSFPFRGHPLISNARAYGRRELEEFVAYCGGLGIEVIPLQQCFGHVEYILQHERYAHLRESESDVCQLCPCKGDEALALFEEVFRELIAVHPSPYLHIGGDETYLLGHCPRCRAVAEREGKSSLYVRYFRRMAALVVKLGRRPVLWADMLLKHPENAAEMPPECVFVDWNYGWPADRFGDPRNLMTGRFEFWGAPAMRSAPDNHSLTCWGRHLNNLRDYLPHARGSGFRGVILTSWSTSGVYGYHCETAGRLLEILPARRVYPISGFTILLDAFRAAVDATEAGGAFSPEDFVADWARGRLGLGADGGRRLWQALNADATPVESITDWPRAVKAAGGAVRLLAGLRPKRNAGDLAHLRLMAELRAWHVRCGAEEARIHSAEFTAGKAAGALRRLDALLAERAGLERRFARLNRGVLHADELREESDFRSKKLRLLRARLARTARTRLPLKTTNKTVI